MPELCLSIVQVRFLPSNAVLSIVNPRECIDMAGIRVEASDVEVVAMLLLTCKCKAHQAKLCKYVWS